MELTRVGGVAGSLVQVGHWLKVSSKRLRGFVEKEFFWRLETYTNVAGEVSVTYLSGAVSRVEPCRHIPIGTRVVDADPSHA